MTVVWNNLYGWQNPKVRYFWNFLKSFLRTWQFALASKDNFFGRNYFDKLISVKLLTSDFSAATVSFIHGCASWLSRKDSETKIAGCVEKTYCVIILVWSSNFWMCFVFTSDDQTFAVYSRSDMSCVHQSGHGVISLCSEVYMRLSYYIHLANGKKVVFTTTKSTSNMGVRFTSRVSHRQTHIDKWL